MQGPRATLAAAALLLLGGCTREVTDANPTRPVSKGPWNVEGVRLGATLDACKAELGVPDRLFDPANGAPATAQWTSRRQVHIAFPPGFAGGATEITGDSLREVTGDQVVWEGITEDEVRAAFPQASERKHRSPSGSGVISLGMTHTGTTFTFSDENATYDVYFHKGHLGSVRAYRTQTR